MLCGYIKRSLIIVVRPLIRSGRTPKLIETTEGNDLLIIGYFSTQLRAGLKPGRVIRVTRVTFSPGHPGLTRFIKYPGLTRIDCTIRIFRSFGAWITRS